MKKRLYSCMSSLCGTLAGKLLISHPIVDEERFVKTIVFIESDDENGTSGFVVNRPLHFMLKALGPEFENLAVSNAPVYHGGEVGESTVMVTAWALNADAKTFEIYHSLNADEAKELAEKYDNIQFRAYLGYCEFDKKIYNDIDRGLWIISSPKYLLGLEDHEENLWKTMLLKESPNALVYK